MAALSPILKIEIYLTINGVEQEVIVADETTTTDVLPVIKADDVISGYAKIYLPDNDVRVAHLDETEVQLSETLKFKVPYKYRAYDLSNDLVDSGEYFSRNGIDLSVYTDSTIAGWECDGTIHYGSVVTGVRGDIDLYAVLNTGSITIPDVTVTVSGYPSTATANSGIYRLADLTGSFTVKANPASASFPSGAKYVWSISKIGGSAVSDSILDALQDNDEITITSAMLTAMGISSFNDISTNSSNPDKIKVICTVKHDALPSSEWRSNNASPLQIKIWRLPTVSATIGTSTLYAAASNSLGQTTITVTGATGTPGTPVVTPASASSLLTFGTPQQVSSDTYTISVSIASDASGTDCFGKVWFNNNTTVGIQIPDPSGATADAGNVTLKNKYQYTLQGYSSTGAVFFSNVDDGTTVDFSTAAAKYSSVPAGRSIVAFKDTVDGTIYKESDFPITFNSTNFDTRRDITLKAILNFSYSVKDTNDGALSQQGTTSDPYILTLGGTGANSGLHVSVPSGEVVGIMGTTFDPTGVLSVSNGSSPYNNPRIGIRNSATADTLPASPIKVTIADSGTGASRDFYVKVIIGTKASPDTVGDIVFKDGTACAYDETTLTSAQLSNAVAVIFQTAGGRKLGIALSETTGLAWALSGTPGADKNFDTSTADGSGNWDKIKAGDSTAASNPGNYPVFNYCNNFSVPGCTSGWYLPARDELQLLSQTADAVPNVNTALNKITGATPIDQYGTYWTSSQAYWGGANYNQSYGIDMGFGSASGFSRNLTDKKVRAVHEF